MVSEFNHVFRNFLQKYTRDFTSIRHIHFYDIAMTSYLILQIHKGHRIKLQIILTLHRNTL